MKVEELELEKIKIHLMACTNQAANCPNSADFERFEKIPAFETEDLVWVAEQKSVWIGF